MSVPLVVMAKVPSPGRVKTRLVPALGPDRAADLARAMAGDVFDTAKRAFPRWRVALDGDPTDPFCEGLPTEPQAEGDLGARLRHALRDGGIAIGTDAPTLDAYMLRGAADALTRADVVFAPAFDGGYVLVGVRPQAAVGNGRGLDVFDGVPWSAPDTFAASVERAQALGLVTAVLPFWYDVDEPRDLAFLRAHLRTLPDNVAPRTRAFLQDSPDAAAHR